ncbi:E3 ubiquitin-protein ligase TRIM39-like [Thamnophis elegans]|uniref:E3 ubiquitin-protein ligase TRIM39-like n=1 Tax=Thamnophis elegans TaxID=35005 RepID=UPI001378D10E|nr:E3 ubiquitin-protein ligase TRIM39-like [Thamnophis elegans]
MSQEITIKTFCSEVTCSICLEYFRDPVLLQCGHNFCHDCVMKYWREFVLQYICPQCKMASGTEGVLPNKSLEKFARLLEQRKQEAGGKEACEKHQAPWKYFCKNHQAPFCKWCAGSKDHEGHVKISLEQATQEFKDYFRELLVYIENQKSAILQHKSSIEKESLDIIKATQTMKKVVEDRFEELRRFLNSEEHTQNSKISEVEKNAIQKQEERMDELFWQFSSCDKMMRELQKKCGQQPNDLLQDVSSTLERCKKKEILQHLKLFPPKNRWELWNVWDANIFLKKAFKQFQVFGETQGLLPRLLPQPSCLLICIFYFFPPPAVITLDKKTAHPLLLLSTDCKSVTLGNEEQSFPKSRKRFDTSHIVLGCEEFKKGRSYWDISMGHEGDWTVGVAQKSVKRKNTISIEPKSGIWAIGKRGSDYFAFETHNCSPLQPNQEPRKIRVFLNYPGKHLSFFDADEATILHHTYTNTASKEAFVPFFHLSHKAVLTLTP